MSKVQPIKIPGDSYFTPAQVAAILEISTTRLIMLRQKGKIKGFRVGNQYIYPASVVKKFKAVREQNK